MSIGLIIPARMASTRLPGKPLIDIAGKTMIQRTWERCVSFFPKEQVFVATDSEQIRETVARFGGQSVLTSETCKTGTDRVAEANEYLGFDQVINVQGDEPLIDPNSITKMAVRMRSNDASVYCGYAEIGPNEMVTPSIPKVLVSRSEKLLYCSRAALPCTKLGVPEDNGYKQVCVYGFTAAALKFFAKENQKSYLESIEDIEILRFLEFDYEVQMVKMSSQNIAVDTNSDLQLVEERLKNELNPS